jgi:predicted ATPase
MLYKHRSWRKIVITGISVEGLRGLDHGKIEFRLQEGLNIITGKNGTGKTTLLKLMWYLLSGNIEQALIETPFQWAKIESTKFSLEVDNRRPEARVYKIDNDGDKSELQFEYDEDGDPVWYGPEEDPDDQANAIISGLNSTLFFPTFRRIEGGFGITRRSNRVTAIRMSSAKPSSTVEAALEEVSRRLSNERHTFVCSVSTSDIANILLQRYAELSEESNRLQSSLSQWIVDRIKINNTISDAQDGPNVVLQDVLQRVEKADFERERIFQPIEGVRSVVSDIFSSKSISFGSRLNFGDAASAVASDVLSAGEKQMLSFICYNALNNQTSIFIDEPELSLHVDWQRILFSTLENQSSSNQFIIATHSPFIYSKYPHREVRLSSDRGNEIQ